MWEVGNEKGKMKSESVKVGGETLQVVKSEKWKAKNEMLVKILKAETKNEKDKCRVNRKSWEVKSDNHKGKSEEKKVTRNN